MTTKKSIKEAIVDVKCDIVEANEPTDLQNAIAEDGLPAEPTTQTVSPLQIRELIIAPPGWGKTTFMMNHPGALLLAFEEGHMFVKGFKIIIDSWMGLKVYTDAHGNIHMSADEALKRILKSDRFPFVVCDTVDAAAKMCADYFCERDKVEHIADLGDYGRGYDLAQNNPIRRYFNQILKTGRGIGYTTHEEIKNEMNKKKEVVKTTLTSSMPNGVMKFLFPQVDVILHGEFGGVPEGEMHRQRIIRTEGAEEYMAKNRGGLLPPAFIVPEDGECAWEMFKGFFEDKSTVRKAYEEYLESYEEITPETRSEPEKSK